MRSRNIKPSFFKNEKLAALPAGARLLFIGLWCVADRAGRLEERPLRLKAEIFPYEHDASTMLDWLKMLEDEGFLIRYEKDANRYVQIVNFDKHQYPHVREQVSTIPAPGKTRARTSPARLNPSSLNPESITDTPAAPGKPGVSEFEIVWKDYPRKLGKDDAFRHFQRQVLNPEDFENIKLALVNFKADLKKHAVEERYIPHGSTWFNSKWRDYVNGVTNGTNGSTGAISYRALLREQKEAEKLREDLAPREVPAGGRDMPPV
jgi:hypothetical protein